MLSPEEVVRTFYLSQADDDWERTDAVMLKPSNHMYESPNYGLIGIVIHDIREYHGDRFEELADMWIASDVGKGWGLTSSDNLAIVLADAQILYDSRIVGIPDSEESNFFLVRKDANSPWKIAACGAGHISYSQEYGADAER